MTTVRRLLQPAWEVTPPRDLGAFIRNLPHLLPEGTFLVLEGGSIAEEVQEFLRGHQPPSVPEIALDTIWPKPEVFHLAIGPETMNALSAFAPTLASPEIADHIKAYRDDQEVLAMYDVSCHDPWLAAATVTEERLTEFCRITGCQFRPYQKK
ncbi:MAG: hypothetical protein NTV86_19955 [Planctomycetota bacterium]|nr:hypothetical protein [Planctomycetota bacterium]